MRKNISPMNIANKELEVHQILSNTKKRLKL